MTDEQQQRIDQIKKDAAVRAAAFAAERAADEAKLNEQIAILQAAATEASDLQRRQVVALETLARAAEVWLNLPEGR